ncbi:MAG: hypothetical protein ACYSTY_13195, partial [Planctomycetota bacterium]
RNRRSDDTCQYNPSDGAYPAIVIARWNNAEITPHNLVEDNAIRKVEAFTELGISRLDQAQEFLG